MTSLVFGVLLADPANPAKRQLFRSTPVKVSIAPGDTQVVKVGMLTLADLDEFAPSGRPKVTLGVLEAVWTDGAKWRFDLAEGVSDFTGTGRMLASESR